MNIIAISNGQGAPSMMLLLLAQELRVTLSFTADTGWESDMLWSTGERTTSREYFDRVTKPLAESLGIEAVYVRAYTKNGQLMPGIPETQELNSIDIPLYGSNGGKLKQSCTSKWKVQAIRQELRRRGAKTATTMLGLTMDEVYRMNETDRKWNQTAYPLINRGIYRVMCQDELNRQGIPYLITTECDGYPHKDPSRWLRTSQETINHLTKFEARFKGEFFLTRELIPLNQVVEKYHHAKQLQISFLDSCESGYCFT